MVAGPLLRALRAAVFTAVCVGLSVAGHTWMSGRAVAPWAVTVSSAIIFTAAYGLGARQRRFESIAAAMLAFQAALHVLLSAAQGVSTAAQHAQQTSMPPGMPAPSMPGMSMSGGTAGGGMAVMGHGPWGMLAAHAIVGVVCSWWLERGEAVLFDTIWALIICALAPLGVTAARCRDGLIEGQPRTAPVCPPRELSERLLSHVLVRRGPPTSVSVS